MVNFDETIKCLAAGVFKLNVALNHPPPAGSLHAWCVFCTCAPLVPSLLLLLLTIPHPPLFGTPWDMLASFAGTPRRCCRRHTGAGSPVEPFKSGGRSWGWTVRQGVPKVRWVFCLLGDLCMWEPYGVAFPTP